MLVLSRKAGQKLHIGNDIVITVTKIAGNRVTLGIQAPDEMRILRGELSEFEVIPAGSAAEQEASRTEDVHATI